jgi:hypothetical protein
METEQKQIGGERVVYIGFWRHTNSQRIYWNHGTGARTEIDVMCSEKVQLFTKNGGKYMIQTQKKRSENYFKSYLSDEYTKYLPNSLTRNM